MKTLKKKFTHRFMHDSCFIHKGRTNKYTRHTSGIGCQIL